jgi:hypothetical protein
MTKTSNFFVAADPQESSEKRVARFKQWFNRSRVGNLLKERRYRQKALTRRQVRDAALVREAYRAERERNKYYQ